MADDRTIEELRAHIASLEQAASLGYLISAVVHEVNNPLSVMLIGADQLRHAGVQHPAVQRHLDALDQQSERIIAISQRLQEMGRRNLAGRREWDLRELLRSFVALDEVLEQPPIAIQLAVSDEALPVEVNGPQLLTVLRFLTAAARRLAGRPGLGLEAGQREIPLIAAGPAAARSPTRTFAVATLRGGAPSGELVAYKEIVPDFFSGSRPEHEVELAACWEVIRKLAGKLLIRSDPAGAEIQLMIPRAAAGDGGRR